MRRYTRPIALLSLFLAFGFVLSAKSENRFYLFNFAYIGSTLTTGLILFEMKWRYARQFVQFAIGSYMLVYLGCIMHENMQLSGFFYYLFMWTFQAATLHYAVAKIVGPLVFGRGWCGYACWTAMILDLLPFIDSENLKVTFDKS